MPWLKVRARASPPKENGDPKNTCPHKQKVFMEEKRTANKRRRGGKGSGGSNMSGS